MIKYFLNVLFSLYTCMLIMRIVLSWFPSQGSKKLFKFVSFYTDPYLNFFKKIVPPLGALDLSPLLAFFCLKFVEKILMFLLKAFI